MSGNLIVHLPNQSILFNSDIFSPGEFDPNVLDPDPAYPLPAGFHVQQATLLRDDVLPALGIVPFLHVGGHGTVATAMDLTMAIGG